MGKLNYLTNTKLFYFISYVVKLNKYQATYNKIKMRNKKKSCFQSLFK
jgi:hypothetical protein